MSAAIFPGVCAADHLEVVEGANTEPRPTMQLNRSRLLEPVVLFVNRKVCDYVGSAKLIIDFSSITPIS